MSAAAPSLPNPASTPLDATDSTPRDRAAINRENAQHSTGPKTAEGKERVRLNAASHGLYSKTVVLPGEDAQAFAALGESLHRKWQPETDAERDLVRALHETEWRVARIVSMESALFMLVAGQHRESVEALYEGDESIISALARAAGFQANARQFDQLNRHEARLNRFLDKTGRELKQLIANRAIETPVAPPQPAAASPAPEPSGFVSSISAAARYPANMPAFSGPLKKEHRRQWLRKNGYGHLAK